MARIAMTARLALGACFTTGLLGVLPACDHAGADQGATPATKEPPPPQPSAPAPGGGTPATTDTPPAPATPSLPIETVTISGKKFKLELAAEPVSRFRGLSGRTEIAEDGGMLFVFDRPSVQQFVMRDCPIPIDIIYLDGSGRVVSFYKMTPEPPRTEAEKVNDPGQTYNRQYEERLKRYHSKFAAQFVIELKGNTLDGLNVKVADKLDLDIARLKKLAK